MKRFLSYIIGYALLLVPGIAVAAETLDFTYDLAGDECETHGYGKEEIYDVAVRICNPMFVGRSVTGLSVYLPGTGSQVSECSGWISSELKLVTQSGKKINFPDLASKPGSTDGEGMLSIVFDKPVVIPEGGLYVGYTFRLSDAKHKPIAFVPGDSNDGLYVHSTRSVSSWKSIVSQLGGVSPIVVSLSGDFPDRAVDFDISPDLYVAKGKNDKVKLQLSNCCSETIRSLGYTYSIGGHESKGEIMLDDPLRDRFGASITLDIELDAQDVAGTYLFSFQIDKVNDYGNELPAVHEGEITVMAFVPENRPLVEEYTGLWCGYCPRGYVAMEQLNKKYGDLFVGMAYHDKDAMSAVESYPSDITGFPSAVINRTDVIQPENIEFYWEKEREKYALGEINAEARWTDESKTRLEVNAVARFVKDFEAGRMKVSYALVADGLRNDAWLQSNNYSGSDNQGDFWNLFTEASGKVQGLVYNDVVAFYDDFNGVEGSVPGEIKADTELHHSYTFDIAKAFMGNAGEVMRDCGRLRAVVSIIDTKTGVVINSNSTGSYYPAGISGTESDAAVVAEKCYSLSGQRIAAPELGEPYILVEIMSDGRSIARKRIAR